MAVLPTSPAQPQAIPEIKQAGELFQKGQLEECLKLLEATVKKHPQVAAGEHHHGEVRPLEFYKSLLGPPGACGSWRRSAIPTIPKHI